MTFSIVARCARTNQLGAAAVTAMPAVGKLVTYVEAGVGAIATQASTNPYYGIDGLALLRTGRTADAVLKALLADDAHREVRQVGIVDADGQAVSFSGADNLDWRGHHIGDGFAVQGNRLTGPDVVDAIADTFANRADLDLAQRLLEAMEAGHAKGGDREEERSGHIFVFDQEQYPLCDLRVDDSDDPIAELHRLFGLYVKTLREQFLMLPRRFSSTDRVHDSPVV
ncbi:MAG TPA: DUF1028 domain-containing protein [Tepidisphaeraceae bacterium]|jgi:uncharacterized Ntn-hydrolase superfamily protein|nr:DUF1028 domain-containing protein [Tepidisphaeraceae bacterium]